MKWRFVAPPKETLNKLIPLMVRPFDGLRVSAVVRLVVDCALMLEPFDGLRTGRDDVAAFLLGAAGARRRGQSAPSSTAYASASCVSFSDRLRSMSASTTRRMIST